MKPIDFVDEAGEFVCTVQPAIPIELLPKRKEPPRTLWQIVNKGNAAKIHTERS